MSRRVVTPARVRFGETDAAGIVFYPTFFVWFDLGTHGLLRDPDGAAARAPGGGPRWMVPIVEAGATFRAPLFFDEEIEIVATVAAVGRSSFRVEHAIRRGADVVAEGFEARVFVRLEGGRSSAAPLPPDLRERLGTPG